MKATKITPGLAVAEGLNMGDNARRIDAERARGTAEYAPGEEVVVLMGDGSQRRMMVESRYDFPGGVPCLVVRDGHVSLRIVAERVLRRAEDRRKYAAVYEAAAALRPGEWFVWHNAPKSAAANLGRFARRRSLQVHTYLAVDGSRIVAHTETREEGR